jgi:ribosomal protein L10
MLIKSYPLEKTIRLKEISQLINSPLCLFFQLNNLSNYELINLKNELAENSLILKSAKTSFLNIIMKESTLSQIIKPFKGSIFIGVSNSEPFSIKKSIERISNSSQILLIGGIYEGKLFNDLELKILTSKSKISCVGDIVSAIKLIPESIGKDLIFQSNLLFNLIKVSKTENIVNVI